MGRNLPIQDNMTTLNNLQTIPDALGDTLNPAEGSFPSLSKPKQAGAFPDINFGPGGGKVNKIDDILEMPASNFGGENSTHLGMDATKFGTDIMDGMSVSTAKRGKKKKKKKAKKQKEPRLTEEEKAAKEQQDLEDKLEVESKKDSDDGFEFTMLGASKKEEPAAMFNPAVRASLDSERLKSEKAAEEVQEIQQFSPAKFNALKFKGAQE